MQEHVHPAALDRSGSGMPPALVAMSPHLVGPLFSPNALEALRAEYELDLGRPAVTDFGSVPDAVLERVEVLITGWGAPAVDAALLTRMPRLRAVLHAGGATDHFARVCRDRGVRVVDSGEVNAVPVAEYAAAMIILCARQVFRSQVLYRRRRAFIDREAAFPEAGTRGTQIGIVGASRIGRRVVELLRPTELRIVVADPFLDQRGAEELGVRKVSLDELLTSCPVVSLHAPLVPSTERMIGRAQLARIPDGTTLINTARGGLIDHQSLVPELVSGRLWAVLDTTDPFEPLPPASPLWDLDNVILTPHVAGSLGNELGRLGDHVVAQAVALANGLPLDGEVHLTGVTD